MNSNAVKNESATHSTARREEEATQSPRRWRRRIVLAILLVPVVLGGLFALNGLVLAERETPISSLSAEQLAAAEAGTLPGVDQPQLKVMAYNIAKAFAHLGDISFEDPEVVRERLDRMAELIRVEQPDLLFLSEAVFECSPCPVNQVEFLAQQTDLKHWVCGENYNFGLPFYRVVGGNAILSRFPIEPAANPPLPGAQAFYVTKNNRRMLWAKLRINGQEVLLSAVHNDSFDMDNNVAQIRQILAYAGDRPAILAGDFNAKPDETSIEIVQETGRFSGQFAGPMTFPAKQPNQTIDFIFAPASWELVEHHVPQSKASDHLPVVSTFQVPVGE